MNPQEKELLEETAGLARENNKILRSLRRSARVGQIIRVAYWVILIGASVGAYYYIQPYLEQLLGVYTGLQNGVGNINSFFNL